MHFCNLEKSRHSNIGAHVNFYEEINLRLEILLVNEDTVLTTITIHGQWAHGWGDANPTQTLDNPQPGNFSSWRYWKPPKQR